MAYMIESVHTKEECLKALDEILAKDPSVLKSFRFACASGDHRGWAFVESDSRKDALAFLPEFIRDKATVREVKVYTPEEIRAFHEERPQPSA